MKKGGTISDLVLLSNILTSKGKGLAEIITNMPQTEPKYLAGNKEEIQQNIALGIEIKTDIVNFGTFMDYHSGKWDYLDSSFTYLGTDTHPANVSQRVHCHILNVP